MELLGLLALPLGLICLSSTWAGLMVSVLVGFGQDVVRKSLPDQPFALNGAVAVCLLLTIIGHTGRKGFSGAGIVPGWPRIRGPILVFLGWVVVSGVYFLARSGNVVLWGLGAFFYLAPVVVVPFFCGLTRAPGVFERAARWYTLLGVVAAISVLVSFVGIESWALDQVGIGIVAYDMEAGAIKLFCGLLRSSEIAAWHGAMTAMLLILGVLTGKRGRIWWIGALVPVIVFATLLTGRRKAVVSVVIFCVVLGLLLLRGRVGRARMAMAGLTSVVGVVALLFSPLFSADTETRRGPYLRRSQSTLDSFDDRLRFTMDSISWSLWRGGVLGLGPGASAQGGQYFGVEGGVGGAAEAGAGKIILELGVIGVALGGRAAIRLIGLLARKVLSRRSPGGPSVLMSGGAAILVANGASFFTAQQVFGDPFVLLILSSILGAMLSGAIPASGPPEERGAVAAGP